AVAVAVEPRPGGRLVQPFQERLRIVAAVARSRAVERGLHRQVEAGRRGRDDRLVEDERPSHAVLEGEGGVLLEPTHAEAEVDVGQGRPELRDDRRELAEDGRAYGTEATRVVEQQEHVYLGRRASGRDGERHRLRTAVAPAEVQIDAGRIDSAAGRVALPRPGELRRRVADKHPPRVSRR